MNILKIINATKLQLNPNYETSHKMLSSSPPRFLTYLHIAPKDSDLFIMKVTLKLQQFTL